MVSSLLCLLLLADGYARLLKLGDGISGDFSLGCNQELHTLIHLGTPLGSLGSIATVLEAYDLVEVDEFAYGSRRESVITALPQFFQKFGSAIGVWTVGFVLQLAGYNKANSVQPITVAKGIENNVTILPAAFLVLSIIGVYLYPVTKEKFSQLKAELEKKKASQEYSTDGLEKLV